MGDPSFQEGGYEGEEEAYSLVDVYGNGYTVNDPCPDCAHGFLNETDIGLSCDDCGWDIVDPKKFKQKEEDGDDL